MKELELCYSPVFGTAKDVVNQAALAALNLLYGRVRQVPVTKVRELVETGERTALIVLHDPALALRWCRRLLLLAGGRLVDNVATEGMGAEALQAVLRQLYPTIQVRRDESGRFYCLPD